MSYTSFLEISTKHFILKSQAVYAANAYDINMLGGYAEERIVDATTGQKEFLNIHTFSYWNDVQTTGKRFQPGFFYGYTQNMGTGKLIEGPLYARGDDIKNVYRFSPRVVYNRYPFEISLEGEYTAASYGTVNGDRKGGVTGTKAVSNFRTLLSVKYLY